MAASLTYIGSTGDGGDASSYTFSGVSIGAAASDRLVIAVVTATGSPTANANVARTAFTINGSAATVVASGKATYSNIDIGVLLVPAGTTTDVAITYDDTKQRATCDIYTLTEADGPAAYDSATSSVETSGTTSSVTLDIPDGGVALFATSAPGTNTTVSWSSASEDYDGTVGGESTTRAGAHKSGPATGHTETATYAASVPARFTAGVSWARATRTATAAIAEAGDSASAAGTLAIAGAAAPAEAGDSLAATGALAITGAGVVTEAGDTPAAFGLHGGTDGTATLNETGDEISASATSPRAGAGLIAESDGSSSASATLRIKAVAAIADAGDWANAAGMLPLTAVTAAAEADDGLSATLHSKPRFTAAGRIIRLPAANRASRTLRFASSQRVGRSIRIQE